MPDGRLQTSCHLNRGIPRGEQENSRSTSNDIWKSRPKIQCAPFFPPPLKRQDCSCCPSIGLAYKQQKRLSINSCLYINLHDLQVKSTTSGGRIVPVGVVYEIKFLVQDSSQHNKAYWIRSRDGSEHVQEKKTKKNVKIAHFVATVSIPAEVYSTKYTC